MICTSRFFRQFFFLCTAILCAYFFPERANCQNQITLSHAIELALKNNLQMAVARNEREESEKARAEINSTGLPQFKSEISAIYAPANPSFGYDPVITNQGQLGAQVLVQQSLYDGGTRGLKSDQLSLGITEANIQLQSVQRDLKYSVTLAFIDVLRYQQETTLRRETVDQLQEYLELTQRRFHGGGTGESDVLRTDVELSNAKVELNHAEVSYNSARYSLAELLGGKIDTTFTATGILDSLIDVPADTLPGRVLDLELSRTDVQKSQLDIALAEHEAYPVLSLFGDAGLLTSVENLKLSGGDRYNSFGYSVGILAEFPIFDWGGRSLRKEQKELELNSLSTEGTLLERKLSGEMSRLRLQRMNELTQLETLRRNAAKAKDLFLLTKARYAGGSALAVEVLGAQQLVNDSEVAALETSAEIQSISARIIQLTTEEER